MKERPGVPPTWRELLGRDIPKQATFVDLIALAIRQDVTGATVVSQSAENSCLVVDMPIAKGRRVFLHNLFASLDEDDPEQRVEAVEHFLTCLFDEAQNEPAGPSQVVPLIKSTAWIEDTVSLGEGESPELVSEPLVADLHIVYAIDTPLTVKMLSPETQKELALTTPELRALAIENLQSLARQPEIHGEPGMGIVVCGGSYEASLLLVDSVWQFVEEHIEGEVLACVPTRDVLAIADSKRPNALRFLRGYADKLFDKAASYLISRTILRRHEGVWKPFELRP